MIREGKKKKTAQWEDEEHRKLKRKKAIASQGGAPYRITRRGLELVRSEFDNR